MYMYYYTSIEGKINSTVFFTFYYILYLGTLILYDIVYAICMVVVLVLVFFFFITLMRLESEIYGLHSRSERQNKNWPASILEKCMRQEFYLEKVK